MFLSFGIHAHPAHRSRNSVSRQLFPLITLLLAASTLRFFLRDPLNSMNIPFMKRIALVLGVGVLCCLPIHLAGSEPAEGNTNDGKSRYRMFSPPVANGGLPEIYVIDTLTGRIWRRTVFNDVRGAYMVPVPYLTANQLSASVAPAGTEAFENLALQNQYKAEVELAKQRMTATTTNQPAAVAAPPPKK